MKVILLERVQKLGQMGEEVEVKAGYARNYLLPQKKALRATKQNISFFATKRAELEATNLHLKAEAKVVAEKMHNVLVSLVRQASEMGHLYGSVRSADISQALANAGYKVDRNQIQIDKPIKILGLHQVNINLHPEVAVGIRVNVALSEEEATVQAAAITSKGAKAKAEPEVAAEETPAAE